MANLQKKCSDCGYELSGFYSTGMLGCPHCYKNFFTEIKGAINSVQGGKSHTGKKPVFTDAEIELLAEYERLLFIREQAEKKGEYLLADGISSDLYELEDELSKRGIL